jgi:Bacterial archaeo-eukaryotic release factor family 2
MKLEFLRDLCQPGEYHDGSGFVTVYLDASPTEATRKEVGLRWRAARDELAQAGADDQTLDALQDQVSGRPPHQPGLAVFARDGAVRLARPLPWRPRDGVSRYAPLPHVMPLLEQLGRAVPHVRVSASRTGARLLTCPELGPGTEIAVEGERWPVHKVSQGGPSERRLQRSAEETWADNARRIADVTSDAAEGIRAAFVLVGGDERERTAVIDALPEAVRETVVTVDREADPDSASFAAAAQAETARRLAAQAGARLDDFRAQISRTEPGERRAVEGLDATLAALRAGLADSVVISRNPSFVQWAWAGPNLADAAVSATQLRWLGVEHPFRDRADAILARAVCGTDAELFFLPDEADPPLGGIGALLRAPASAVLSNCCPGGASLLDSPVNPGARRWLYACRG